jgi:hypothetical protein
MPDDYNSDYIKWTLVINPAAAPERSLWSAQRILQINALPQGPLCGPITIDQNDDQGR